MNKFPSQVHDEDGPVFNEPWEAQAFGLVIALHQAGQFTWQEWSTTLAEVINTIGDGERADQGESYYQHWLQALERISSEKALTNNMELSNRMEQWRNAYLRTPHGHAVELQSD